MPRDDDMEQEDLAELRRRRELTEDPARSEAVSKRHDRGGRTARENVADLIDEGCGWSTAVTPSRNSGSAVTRRT